MRRFFASVKALYGIARFQAQWDSKEMEAAAMKLWARDILRYSWKELNAKLMFAKSMMHQDDWKHPDIAKILNGDKQAGAAGAAALSYRPATEVINALPKPVQDKTVGQAALDSLRDQLSLSVDAEKKARAEWRSNTQDEIQALVDKHLPYGKYQAPEHDVNGDLVGYVPTDIDHPVKGLAGLRQLSA